MTARRSRAYGRIVRVLESPAASQRITAKQRDLLREAADTLVLSRTYDRAAREALAEGRAVLLSARTGDLEPWIEQLADDLEDAGPGPQGEYTPTASQVRGVFWSPLGDRPTRR